MRLLVASPGTPEQLLFLVLLGPCFHFPHSQAPFKPQFRLDVAVHQLNIKPKPTAEQEYDYSGFSPNHPFQ
ncbi:hypothetical protein DSO57_1038054 [Entomophthora muscae]|uniref:Uncharacterized protein n=1 Tax=Entomophthora muscae TaxID=34485 RepID=A0ACC2TKV6_9FUNG|nr:hypothetical protein DSO57_1038054 [Entomophthora muscae]